MSNDLPIEREQLMALIPHKDDMCLLDRVLRWDAHSILCQTWTHQREDNPLRRAGQLSALHLCEYGAQAMAAHGGLLAAEQGGAAKPGLLVSLRGVELHVDYINALPLALDVRAQQLMASDDSWLYEFRIEHVGALLASGRAAVILRGIADEQ